MTLTAFVPLADVKLRLVGETVNCTAPACVTSIVLVTGPVVTVTRPERALELVFLLAEILMLLLPLPEVGVTVNQLWLSLTDQEVFELTLTLCAEPASLSVKEVLLTDN